MPYNNTFSYIVRAGTSHRITDTHKNPLIVDEDSINKKVAEINKNSLCFSYESIKIDEYNKKYTNFAKNIKKAYERP